jgi:ASC-1-like (ASCH) protein
MNVGKPLRLNVRRPDSYKAIKDKEKYAEVRLFRGCISRIKKDDIIYLSHGDDHLKIYVDKLKIFGSIEEMLENDLVKKAAGGIKRKLDIKFYEQFYRIEEIRDYKIAVIFFRLV